MIDIKGCLRISVHKLVRLCELTLSFITALAPIDLLGYFKSGFRLSEGQCSMVHGAKERGGGVELPDGLMYEAVLQSAGPSLETLQSPP